MDGIRCQNLSVMMIVLFLRKLNFFKIYCRKLKKAAYIYSWFSGWFF